MRKSSRSLYYYRFFIDLRMRITSVKCLIVNLSGKVLMLCLPDVVEESSRLFSNCASLYITNRKSMLRKIGRNMRPVSPIQSQSSPIKFAKLPIKTKIYFHFLKPDYKLDKTNCTDRFYFTREFSG